MLAYWVVVIASMESVVDKSKLGYLIRSRRSYTLVHRDALVSNSFKDRFSDIKMNGSAFIDDNVCAYDALIPGIFGNLAEEMLTSTIKNKHSWCSRSEEHQLCQKT